MIGRRPANDGLMAPDSPTTIRRLHFRDRRPPHEVQFALERSIMLLLAPTQTDPHLTCSAAGAVNGVPFGVVLQLNSAGPTFNGYMLEFQAADTALSPSQPEDPRKPLDGWLDFWCQGLEPAPAPRESRSVTAAEAARLKALTHRALTVEAHLTDVAAIQREIVDALGKRCRFRTSNKEGDTELGFRHGRYLRVDTGDYPSTETFAGEAEFLAFLRRFFHHTVTRSAGTRTLSEFEAWKLILRLMLPPRAD